MPVTFHTLQKCLPNQHKFSQALYGAGLDLGTDTKEENI
jgi:hypothetical protein